MFSLLEKKSLQTLKGYETGIGVSDIRKAFSDHAGHPRSLCEHAEKGEQKYGKTTEDTLTVASVIYDLKNLEMHVCKGNPCLGVGRFTTLVGRLKNSAAALESGLIWHTSIGQIQ